MKQRKLLQSKLVLVGDVGVGKSSITLRYVLDKFDYKMESTLGAAYMDKIHQISPEKSLKLKIWDTAGQQKYKAIAKLYYKDCQIALLVYDITRKETFENLKNWTEQLLRHAPPNLLLAVVGNKIDILQDSSIQIQQQMKVNREQGEAYAKELDAIFYQVSARTKQGIPELFKEIAQKMMQKLQKGGVQKDEGKYATKLKSNISDDEQGKGMRRRCCKNS